MLNIIIFNIYFLMNNFCIAIDDNKYYGGIYEHSKYDLSVSVLMH